MDKSWTLFTSVSNSSQAHGRVALIFYTLRLDMTIWLTLAKKKRWSHLQMNTHNLPHPFPLTGMVLEAGVKMDCHSLDLGVPSWARAHLWWTYNVSEKYSCVLLKLKDLGLSWTQNLAPWIEPPSLNCSFSGWSLGEAPGRRDSFNSRASLWVGTP